MNKNLSIVLLLLFFLPDQVDDLVHDIVHVHGHLDRQRHFVCVVDAHAEQALHDLEFLLIGRCYRLTVWFVEELDYATWLVFLWAENRPDHKIFDISDWRLVVDFINKFCFSAWLVWEIQFVAFKNLTWNSLVAREDWERYMMDLFHFFNSFFFFKFLINLVESPLQRWRVIFHYFVN